MVRLSLRVMAVSVTLAFAAVGTGWSAPLIGGTIAYVQGTEAFEIYVVEAGVGPPVRVWREEDDRIYSVKLSLDGQRVAFESGSHAFFTQVFIVNVDGTDHRQATDFGNRVRSAGAAWSPDSTRIAFASHSRGRTDATLSVAPRDGGDALVLVAAPTRRLGDPAWSPDGTNIAYTVSEIPRVPSELRLLNVATGETTLLTPDVRGDIAWSPGGTQLAFFRSHGARGWASWDILTIPAHPGGEPKHFASLGDWYPAGGLVWLDAEHIAHLSPANVRAIHIANLAGRPQAPLYVEATAPIHSFDWVDPARPVRPAGKRATTLGGLKAGEDAR
ncbi:hypothetical protein CMK11_04835 [Candidatus Poribacteria bacterium]|nr:hypothetical protein [Candidatus Poribacteria bacterium]